MPYTFTTSRQEPSIAGDESRSWRIVVSSERGRLVLPGIGLHAARRGMVVVRQGGAVVRSWGWEAVDEIVFGAKLVGNDGAGFRIVEVRVDGARHRFMCPDEDVDAFRSTIEIYTGRLRGYRGDRQAAPVARKKSALLGTQAPAHVAELVTAVVAAQVPALVAALAAAFDYVRGALARQMHTLGNWRKVTARERLAPIRTGACALVLLGGGFFAATAATNGADTVAHRGDGLAARGVSVMQQMEREYRNAALLLPPATTPPAPAPPSLADAPALASHEIFGFAPYWTLPISSGFDVTDMTTLAYFSLDVNPDGTIDETGPGWAGYQSQYLSDLITRAHQADDRVVLTVTCFDQAILDALTSSATAGGTLASSLVQLLAEKNLDGANLDFEGQGSHDRQGLDKLVAQVSAGLRSADPHWQLSIDTYASSADDSQGFFDISGLAPSVDAFFVMAYDLEAPTTPSPTAPLTGQGFSDLDAVEQYSTVVPPSKVILGVPYYGYDWSTSGPAQGDPATGGASPESYSEISSGAHPVYWDPSTQTPWSSYLVGAQWHQTWFDDATSLALKARLATSYHLAGLGVWALGMDGNDPSMLAALLGHSPAAKGYSPSPVAVPSSASTTTTVASSGNGTNAAIPAASPPATGLPGPSGAGSQVPGSPQAPSADPTTTTVPRPSSSSPYAYSGVWEGEKVTLDKVDPSTASSEAGQSVGQLTSFTTDDPAFSCLEGATGLPVWAVRDASGVYVLQAMVPTDCTAGSWEFVAKATKSSQSSSTASIRRTTDWKGRRPNERFA